MKIASWNVNSLRVRLEHVLQWMDNVDVLALQETKVEDKKFPTEALADFYTTFTGQKTYNGVALLSKHPLTDIQTDLPFQDEQRRFIAATVNDIKIINVYIPNGEAPGTEKYQYKIQWLENFYQYLQEVLQKHDKVLVLGDFNIAPDDRDVYDPIIWQGRILCTDLERNAFQKIIDLGFTDSFREFYQENNLFTWWDYRNTAFKRNLGVRIDHILLTKPLLEQCQAVEIDKTPRTWERPSDHTPIWCKINN